MFNKAICLCYDERLKNEGCPIKDQFPDIELFIAGKGNYDFKYDYIDTFPEEAKRPQAFNYARCLKTIIQRAKDQNVDSLLFLEDDATATDRFMELFPLIQQESQQFAWEAFFLGGIHVNGSYENWTQYIIRPHYSLDLHAIIFKKSLFDEILAFGECYNHTLDGNIINLQRNHLILAANPSIIVQRPCFSYNSFKVEDKIKYYGDIREFSWEKANAIN